MSAYRSILCLIAVLPIFGMLEYLNYSPYTCQRQCVSVKWANRCNCPKVRSHRIFQL